MEGGGSHAQLSPNPGLPWPIKIPSLWRVLGTLGVPSYPTGAKRGWLQGKGTWEEGWQDSTGMSGSPRPSNKAL